jgi:hypothetical protein
MPNSWAVLIGCVHDCCGSRRRRESLGSNPRKKRTFTSGNVVAITVAYLQGSARFSV